MSIQNVFKTVFIFHILKSIVYNYIYLRFYYIKSIVEIWFIFYCYSNLSKIANLSFLNDLILIFRLIFCLLNVKLNLIWHNKTFCFFFLKKNQICSFSFFLCFVTLFKLNFYANKNKKNIKKYFYKQII